MGSTGTTTMELARGIRLHSRSHLEAEGSRSTGEGRVSVIGRGPLGVEHPRMSRKRGALTGNLTLLPYLILFINSTPAQPVFNCTLLEGRYHNHIWGQLGMPRDAGDAGIPPILLSIVKPRERGASSVLLWGRIACVSRDEQRGLKITMHLTANCHTCREAFHDLAVSLTRNWTGVRDYCCLL